MKICPAISWSRSKCIFSKHSIDYDYLYLCIYVEVFIFIYSLILCPRELKIVVVAKIVIPPLDPPPRRGLLNTPNSLRRRNNPTLRRWGGLQKCPTGGGPDGHPRCAIRPRAPELFMYTVAAMTKSFYNINQFIQIIYNSGFLTIPPHTNLYFSKNITYTHSSISLCFLSIRLRIFHNLWCFKWQMFNVKFIRVKVVNTTYSFSMAPTRKKFIHEELPNYSETEDMRKIR